MSQNYIKEHNITEIPELFNTITGKNGEIDLRKNFIFRGLNDINYELIPSALRKNNNGKYEINQFVNPNFQLTESYDLEQMLKDELITQEQYNQASEEESKNAIICKDIDKHSSVGGYYLSLNIFHVLVLLKNLLCHRYEFY